MAEEASSSTVPPPSPSASSVASSVTAPSTPSGSLSISREELLKLSSKLTRRLRSVETKLKRATAANASLAEANGALRNVLKNVTASVVSKGGQQNGSAFAIDEKALEILRSQGPAAAKATKEAGDELVKAMGACFEREASSSSEELAASRALTEKLMRVNRELKEERAHQKSFSEEEKEMLISKCKDAERRVIAFEGECDRLKQDLADTQSKSRGSVAQVAELRAALLDARKTASDCKVQAQKDQQTVRRLKAELTSAAKALEEARASSAAAREKASAAVSASERATESAKEADEALAGAEERAEALRKELDNLNASIKAAEADRKAELEASNLAMRKKHEEEINHLEESHRQTVTRIREEEKKRSGNARRLFEEKENQARALSDRLKVLEKESEEGKPSERRIIQLAKQQAAREATIKGFKDKIQALEEHIKDMDRRNELREVQEAHLKSIIRSHKASTRRNGVNMEYLKNVVYKYLCFDQGTTQSQSLLNVITTLLEFTKKERARVMRQSGFLDYFWGAGNASAELQAAAHGLPRRTSNGVVIVAPPRASTPPYAQWDGTPQSRT